MQQFVVSARKYRPLSWDEVVGQDHIVSTLRNAIKSDHLAQSFLFCGPRGVGKTTCARILAKTINCENLSPEGDACNECESCLSFTQNASFNIHEIDAASNNSVDDIRSLVDQVRYAPQSGKYKVYIIDEVHMLSAQAFNAFLKTLEEPPSYVKFILATTEKYKIIPTILSRCQIFDFNRITIRDMIRQLKKICGNEGIVADDEAFHFIAQKADGAMRDALSIFDRITTFAGKNISAADVIENLNILDYDYYFKVVEMIAEENAAGILLLFNEVTAKGFDGDTFLIGLAEHLRNLLVCMDPSTVSLLETSEAVAARYKEQAASADASFLLSALNVLNQADIQYRVAKNKHLHVELALMKLCYIRHAVRTPGLESSPEKKTADLTNKPPVVQRKEVQEELKTSPKEEEAENKPPLSRQEQEKKPETTGPVVTPSIRLGGKKKEKETTEQPEVSPLEERREISPELFFMAWKQYADLIRKDKVNMAMMMDHARVKLDAGNVIQIQLDSQVEVNMFRDATQDLRQFLADAMSNHQFDLEFSVVEAEKVVQRPYTIPEKYKKMEEINPAIRDLKEQLGLELDI